MDQQPPETTYLETSFLVQAQVDHGTSPFTFVWESSLDNNDWTVLEITDQELPITIEEPTYVRVTVSNAAGSETSEASYLVPVEDEGGSPPPMD